MPLVYIAILSWNDLDALVSCLDSVFQLGYAPFEVIVVDNHSDVDIATPLLEKYPGVKLLINEQNLGFAGGYKPGLEYALAHDAEFLLILNQDTRVPPELITRLVEFANAHPKAGILGPKTYSFKPMADGRERLLYTGAWQGWLPLLQKLPDIGRADQGQHDANRLTEYVWGHGLFARGALLKEIGLFDTKFFMYWEDLDLCVRARNVGYECWYVGDAYLWHDVDDAARASSSELWRWRYKAQGMKHFYQKHYGRWRGGFLYLLTVLDMGIHMAKKFQFRATFHLLQASFESFWHDAALSRGAI